MKLAELAAMSPSVESFDLYSGEYSELEAEGILNEDAQLDHRAISSFSPNGEGKMSVILADEE